MAKLISFLTDSDGLSAKDYLMLIFTTPYIIAWIYLMYLSITTGVPEGAFEMFHSMDGIIMTIVGGWFGVSAITEFKKKDNNFNDKI